AGGEVQVARAALEHFLQQRAQVERRASVRGLSARRGGCHLRTHVAAVSLMTSSSVVMPRDAFNNPSMRRVNIPSRRPCSLSSSVLADCMIILRMLAVTLMTS